MNKIILSLLAVLALTVGKVMAGQPTFIGARDSAYVVSQSSVSISSNATTLTGLGATALQGARISAVSGYRKVKIQMIPTALQDGVSVFYTLNGSTANIYSIGYQVRISTLVMGVSPAQTGGVSLGREATHNEIEIESNSQLNFVTSPGVGPILGRKIELRLPN